MKTKVLLFGITGDLSSRKLLPALTSIVKSGECEPLSIIGVSRREVDVNELIMKATGEDTLCRATHLFTMNVAEVDEYQRLKQEIDLQDDEQLVVYLSVPPSAAADISDFLGEAGINGHNVKLLFEKPFGYDLQSAHDFIERTNRYFNEDQLYRIDHFMAKEVAMGLLELRANADTHHHHWNAETVESVHVVASETLGVEDRAHFYEQTGALRDVIQSHLMQLLSIVLIKVEPDFDLQSLPERRYNALRHIQPADPTEAVRAQYEGYEQEVDNPGSMCETFAGVALTSSDPDWKGVSLSMVTGKRLAEKKTAVTITYKDGSKDVFVEGEIQSSRPILNDAYERVLVEAIKGNKFIFTTTPEVIRSWEILAPLQEAWAMDTQPLLRYKPGERTANVHLQHYI